MTLVLSIARAVSRYSGNPRFDSLLASAGRANTCRWSWQGEAVHPTPSREADRRHQRPLPDRLPGEPPLQETGSSACL